MSKLGYKKYGPSRERRVVDEGVRLPLPEQRRYTAKSHKLRRVTWENDCGEH